VKHIGGKKACGRSLSKLFAQGAIKGTSSKSTTLARSVAPEAVLVSMGALQLMDAADDFATRGDVLSPLSANGSRPPL